VFRAASTPAGKVAAAVMLWAVLFGSKFVVLELVHLMFAGGGVHLGGFLSVTLLIVVLMLSRAAVRHLLSRSAPVSSG
jgi:hypothetical protein